MVRNIRRFNKRPKLKSVHTFVMLACALGYAREASAQRAGDCIGPPLPSRFANFGVPSMPALIAGAVIQRASDAKLPIGQPVYLRLAPLSKFRPALPVRFVPGTWKIEPAAGGFAILNIPRPGNYWIAAHDNLAAVELIPQNRAKPVEPSRIMSVPCRIGLIMQYRLAAGRFRMQFVSASPTTPLVEVTPAGAITGSFAGLSARKRIGR